MLSVQSPLGTPSRPKKHIRTSKEHQEHQHWMIEPIPSKTDQKVVVGQQSRSLKKGEQKERIQI